MQKNTLFLKKIILFLFTIIIYSKSAQAQENKEWTKNGVYTIGAAGSELLMTVDVDTNSLIWSKPLSGALEATQHWLITDHLSPMVSGYMQITTKVGSTTYTMGTVPENISSKNITLTVNLNEPVTDIDALDYGYDQFQRRKTRTSNVGNDALFIKVPGEGGSRFGVVPTAAGDPVQFDGEGVDKLEFNNVGEDFLIKYGDFDVDLFKNEEFNLTLFDITDSQTFSIDSQPSHGKAIIKDGILTYTPDIDFVGVDVFTYKEDINTNEENNINDLESNIYTITLNVSNAPDISFSIDKTEIAEHEAATITVKLDEPADHDVSIDYSSFSGTTSETDFTCFYSDKGINRQIHGGVRFIKFESYDLNEKLDNYSNETDRRLVLYKIKAFTSDGIDVACEKPSYNNSERFDNYNNATLTDCDESEWGIYESSYNKKTDTNSHYILVDLENVYEVERIEISYSNLLLGNYSVLISADGQTWANLESKPTSDDSELFKTYQVSTNGKIVIKKGDTIASVKVHALKDNFSEETEYLTIPAPTVDGVSFKNPQDFTINILDVTTSITRKDNVFEGFSDADFAWGDYDLDGDMDVAIMGDKGNGLETILYRNDETDGQHLFINSGQDFEPLGIGTIKWVDINKDGLIDLFVSGIGQDGPKSQLYRNTTNTNNGTDFELDSSYNFPILFQTSVDFGDLDNDGDIDYAISGTNNEGKDVAFYGFQNTTNQFEIVEANFSSFSIGSIKIFDTDGDGDNDLISSGQTIINNYFNNGNNPMMPEENFEEIVYFKRSSTNSLSYLSIGNNGNPSITSNITGLNIPGFTNGGLAIADFDNDGSEDIFISGAKVSDENPLKEETASVLYKNIANTYEASSGFTFEPLTNATVEWVDFDNDGDLDLFTSGFSPGLGQKTYLYEVEVTNRKNKAPDKITSLNYEDLNNGNIRLSWESPKDDLDAIMGYNLRLGTTPGGSELSYLLSDTQTGHLLVNQPPSIFTNNFSIQLDPGTYYWSVQAVDNGFKGGMFSDEQSFTLTYDWKILNQGGIIDKSILAKSNPILEFMDLDNDGDYDLVYGDRTQKVYSFENNTLKENDSYDLIPGLIEIGVGDINLDGTFDIIGSRGRAQSVISLSKKEDDGIPNTNKTLTEHISLFKRKITTADLNNDGSLNIINIGMDNQNDLLAKFKMYSTSFNTDTNTFTTKDLSDNFSSISQIDAPSFDIGDFDNDQDLDIVISGDLLFGENVTIIYENKTEAGSQNISFQEYLVADLPGIKDGSSTFIDFDSDGDLDLLLSGFDNKGNRIFSMFENVDQGPWKEVETSLPKLSNTELAFGDFNSDGYSDLLISGINSNDAAITQLFEYDDNQGYIESDYDLSEFANAKFAFGDLDGDNDLDFVIAGVSSITDEPLFRVYLNYRSDSYALINNASKKAFMKSSKINFSANPFNSPPTVPSIEEINLVGKNTEGDAIVEVSWVKSSDDYTPDNSISYALKIGTSPGKEDVMSSEALESGYRKKAGKGNAEQSTSWNIGLSPGIYYASVQAIDASYVGSEFSREKMFEVNKSLSIDNDYDNSIQIYPNPGKDIITISIENNHKVKSINIFDVLGKRLEVKSESNNLLNISKLTKGIYTLVLTLDNNTKLTKKIIKD